MPRRILAIAAVALGLTLIPTTSALGQQRNVVFTGVPEFLRLQWEIVAGPDDNERVVTMPGEILTGNQILMLSTKREPKVVGDFLQLDVDTVVQYNLPSKNSDVGYITLFQLLGTQGEAIVYPGVDFWTISLRFGRKGSFKSYVGLLSGHRRELEIQGTLEQEIETQRALLAREYVLLAKGLDPRAR